MVASAEPAPVGHHFDKQGRLHRGPRGWNNARAACEKGLVERRQGICAGCGQQHWLCSGHRHPRDSDGKPLPIQPCEKWPMHGQSVCATHGGKGRNRESAGRQWKKEQAESKAMAQLERTVKTLGLPVTTTPQQALLDEIYRTAGHVAWLEEQVGKLTPGDLVWGTASEEKREGIGEMETSVDLTTTVKQARPHVLMDLYQKERAHLVHVAKVAIQCGIAERQIKLAEEQGRAIADAIRAVFEDPELELSVTQMTVARTVASRVLRTLASTRALPGEVLEGKVVEIPARGRRNGA